MKIFSVDQIREVEAFTIKKERIKSIDLMDRAASACIAWITKRFDPGYQFIIICGLGNNGGDGLAIARLLIEQEYNVEVFIINYSKNRSPDFLTNLQKLKAVVKTDDRIDEINSFQSFQAAFLLKGHAIIIDALFGSGLNKPIEGFTAEIVNKINISLAKIISIDIPSGLYCDELNSNNEIIKANYTLTFQFPKLTFMFPETANCVGEFYILDIGLNSKFEDSKPTQNFFITQSDVSVFLKKRKKNSHKGNFGHSLILAGSYGKMGAAFLASKACLRGGTGLLTVHIPKCGYEIIQTLIPEAMVSADSELNIISDKLFLNKFNAIGIGPGIGIEMQTQSVVKFIMKDSHVPLVLDADAINIISENKTWLSFLPANSILTPHPKEFDRLAGLSVNSMDRFKFQRNFSIKYSVFVILKGMHTSISCPNGFVFFNSTGNPGMAKGGSGDALTGVITALLSQNYSFLEACLLGVYVHGLAGDLALRDKSEESMIASDIIDQLPMAFGSLRVELK